MRHANIVKASGVYECPVTVENEGDMLKAVADVKTAACNALVVFLGNFGPETPETLIAKYFDGPCMFVAAAEGDGDLISGRGDAYCGMLNCSYNIGMRHLNGYIPEYPVGTADEISKMAARPTSRAARWRAILRLPRLPSIACNVTATERCVPILHRARFFRSQRAASAASACSPFPKWVASTAMF